jgi:hypothetical protein
VTQHNQCTDHSAMQVQTAWLLWHKIEELSSMLWDHYYHEFLEKAHMTEINNGKKPENGKITRDFFVD